MLKTLSLTDWVLVDNATVDFTKGLMVLTGETGSGKSVFLSALNAILGSKLAGPVVRPGAAVAIAQATFSISPNSSVAQWLTQENIANCTECSLERRVSLQGRSKATLNGKPITLAQLQDLGSHLLQFHGQHQQQHLNQPSEQRRLLDAFAESHTELASTAAAYQTLSDWEAKKAALERQKNSPEALALLEYQLKELTVLSPEEGEWEKLSSQQKSLSQVDEHQHAVQEGLALLSDNEPSITSQMGHLHRVAETLENDALSSLLLETQIRLDEMTHTLDALSDSIHADPETLQACESRLSALYDMARKHQVLPENLPEHLEALKAEVSLLKDAQASRQSIDAEIAKARQSYDKKAKKLSSRRLKAIKPFSTAIESHLKQLGMPACRFDIQLDPIEAPSLHGSEQVHFLVTTNPEHPPAKLSRIASGGELSRISLAIEGITADKCLRPTLVFDEVDVGISGKVGAMVGEHIKALSQSAQVLVITHLPQVAALADQHFLVKKKQSKRTTQVSIHALSEESRIEAIAQMLGGMEITPEARAHAQSLMEAT